MSDEVDENHAEINSIETETSDNKPASNTAEKKLNPKTKRTIIIAAVIVLALAVALGIGLERDNRRIEKWTYDRSDAQEVKLGAVTVYAPKDWEINKGDDYAEAVYDYTVWIMIEDKGSFSKMSDLKDELEKNNIPTDGESIVLPF